MMGSSSHQRVATRVNQCQAIGRSSIFLRQHLIDGKYAVQGTNRSYQSVCPPKPCGCWGCNVSRYAAVSQVVRSPTFHKDVLLSQTAY
jgi:hypothetical protein